MSANNSTNYNLLLCTRAGLYSFKKVMLEIVTKLYPFVLPIDDLFDVLLCSTNYKIVNRGTWWIGAKKAGPSYLMSIVYSYIQHTLNRYT